MIMTPVYFCPHGRQDRRGMERARRDASRALSLSKLELYIKMDSRGPSCAGLLKSCGLSRKRVLPNHSSWETTVKSCP